MNYSLHYNRLIQKAQSCNRKKYKKDDIRYTYYEKHHIIPESFFIERTRIGKPGHLPGNPNLKTNLVLLTPEEHYVAHQLLIKMYPNNGGLVKAAHLMSVASPTMGGIRNNKKFGWIRKRLAETFSKEKIGKSSPNKGRPSPLKGKVGATKGYASPKKGIKTGPNGKKGSKRGPSPLKGIPSGRKGIVSEKKGIPSGKKGSIRGPNKSPMLKIICPHCDREGGTSQMKRYHFDNCKKNTP